MLAADIEDFLVHGLVDMGLNLTNQPEILSRLSSYFHELKKWNSKVNLVARTLEDQEILENHFLDSLTLLTFLQPDIQQQENLLDVGTGAGFPGLVLKTACPLIAVTLIEPRRNRFYFLKHVARTLNLTGLKIFNIYLEEKRQAEELSGQQFSLITSRAFTDICGFIKLVSPYLQQDGRIVMMKGPGAVAELNDLAQIGLPEGFRVVGQRKLLLPYSGKQRWLISFKRTE